MSAGSTAASPLPRRRLPRGAAIAMLIVLFLLLWEGAKFAFAISDQRLPHLSEIVGMMFSRTQGGRGPLLIVQMLLNCWATFVTAFGGFTLGGLLGFGLALLFLHLPIIERGLLPYVIGSQTVPILAIAPMVVVGLGRLGAEPWLARMIVAAYLTFFPVTIGVLRGLRSVSPQSLDLLHSYAANRWTILLKLRLPAALPQIFGALKIAASASIIGAIVAELPAGAREGIGVMILNAAQFYNSRPPALYLAILCAGLLGVAAYGLVALAERFTLAKRGL